MSCARLFGGMAIFVSLFAIGCGGSSVDDPAVILGQFQKDEKAAGEKYAGKTVRLRVEKVSAADKSGPALEYVTVQGSFVNPGIMINATVSDPTEQQKALALKVGEPAIIEGEVGGAFGETRGMGVIFITSAKVVTE
ncbi:MAG: hypothetical protein KDA66_06920 [Planctomycetaceae bacterium]|nr:hypothetical protein [Planctomycetaceae bacterium]